MYSLTAGMVALLLLAPARSLAQQAGPVLIPELTDEDLARIDLHDGSVQDWLQVVGEPTVRPASMSINVFSSGQYHDPGDLDFRIWLGWHGASNRFYVAMERADDIHVNRFDRSMSSSSSFSTAAIFNQDPVVELHIDGDYGGEWAIPIGISNHDPEFWLQANRKAQVYFAIAETFDDGPHLEMHWLGAPPRNHWFDYPPYADSGGGIFGENPTLSVVEFYVTPFDLMVWNDLAASRVSDLESGKVIGFELRIRDIDNPNSVIDEIQYDFGGYAEALLVESLPPPRDTSRLDGFEAIAGMSWGQLKVSSEEEEAQTVPEQ